jgi:DGQHR domain-containing protein
MPFTVPAVRLVQKQVPMYLTALPISELDFCSIDKWDPRRTGEWKGYQRGLVQKKIRSLAEYLERDDGILPVAGLLNVRKRKTLIYSGPKTSKPSIGKLAIPDDTRLWVVDMQHRLEGIREAYSKGFLDQFSVPVLITEGLSEVKEAAQFYVINTQSKRMGVDLTRRLLIEHGEIRDITDVPEWELKAVQIAIRLNHGIKSNPWYGRIREPEAERMRDHVATEKSFVPSLKWLLTAPKARNRSPRHLAKFLASYWEGIRLNMPRAFETPRSYLIQKTPGFMAFHRLAPFVYRRHPDSPASTYTKLFAPLAGDSHFGEKFWSAKNQKGAKRYGTGQSAYSNLAIDIKDELGL